MGKRRSRSKKVQSELNSLVQDLVPNKETVDSKARYVLNKIFQYLQKNCKQMQQNQIDEDADYEKYSLDRTRIVGSSGKNTDIKYYSDYDCVIFVNNRWPGEDFDDVLEDFEHIIRWIHDAYFEIYESSIRCTSHSVKFKVRIGDTDIKFDLLPAANFIWKMNKNGLDLALKQGQLTLQHIGKANNPVKEGKSYSSSLCELQVAFVKSQTEFVIRAVRIAKFWNKTIRLEDNDGRKIYIPGRSALIETVAIYAAREVENDGTPTNKLVRAFKKFLTLMSSFSTLNIVMSDYLQKIGFGKIPKFILKQEPLILDPANPYNNLAHYTNVDEDCVNLFEEYASETKDRLLNYRSGKISISEVFETQPDGDYEGGVGLILFGTDDDEDENDDYYEDDDNDEDDDYYDEDEEGYEEEDEEEEYEEEDEEEEYEEEDEEEEYEEEDEEEEYEEEDDSFSDEDYYYYKH